MSEMPNKIIFKLSGPFMKLVKSGHRSFIKPKKMLGLKGRLVQFIEDRHKADDLILKRVSVAFSAIQSLSNGMGDLNVI